MASLIRQVQRDAVLLMYIAGELPDCDREEIERRLAADGDFRAELDQLHAAMEVVESGLAQLDASPLNTDAAVRRASVAIRQWKLRPSRARADANDPAPHRWRLWMVPATAAAIVLLVAGISFYQSMTHTDPPIVRLPFPLPAPTAAPSLPQEVAPAVAQADEDANPYDSVAILGPPDDASEHGMPHLDQGLVAIDDSGDKAIFEIPEPDGE